MTDEQTAVQLKVRARKSRSHVEHRLADGLVVTLQWNRRSWSLGIWRDRQIPCFGEIDRWRAAFHVPELVVHKGWRCCNHRIGYVYCYIAREGGDPHGCRLQTRRARKSRRAARTA